LQGLDGKMSLCRFTRPAIQHIISTSESFIVLMIFVYGADKSITFTLDGQRYPALSVGCVQGTIQGGSSNTINGISNVING
jgi:hypothetical protein